VGRPAPAPLVTRIVQLRAVKDRLLATPELFPIAIGRLEGEALRSWVRRERARRTLEVGLGWGVATLFICEGLLEQGADARHVACDPFQFASPKFEGAAVRALEEAGVADLVEFHAEESQVLLPRMLGEGRRFDFAFIDGKPSLRRRLPRPRLLRTVAEGARDRLRRRH
jgi:predicted O-methyltransferase YrrM